MDRARIGYLVKAFPVVSETFILNEIRAMEADGLPLSVLALKPPPDTVRHATTIAVTAPVHAARWGWRRLPGVLADHLVAAARRRRRYLSLLRREIARPALRWARRPSGDRWTVARKRARRLSWAVWADRRCRADGVRHLHAHYAGEPLRVAHLVKRLSGLPYSFTAHAKDLYTAPPTRLQRRLASAEFAVSCHRHGVDTLRQLATDGGRESVRLIRHGIDTDLFRPHGERRRDGLRILAVGRLTEKKGFDTLIEACGRLPADLGDWRCDLVGDGRLRSQLRAAIDERGLEGRIRLHGFTTQEQLPDWYRRATVVVVPSRLLPDGNRDGVPNVLLEAMACGAAVVATPVSGILEWLEDGATGLLSPIDDSEQLAACIERLLRDPELAARLGTAAAERVATLDYRSTNRELAGRFRSILAAPVDAALRHAGEAAWRERGMARKARKRLGRRPRRDDAVERGIRDAIRPGLAANAWRADLDRLASRRLWDEVVKSGRLRTLLPALGADRPGARILDLGSGRGGLCVALQARGHDVVAVDLRWRNCAVTRLRARRYGLDSRAINAVGGRLPFADDSFDAIACLEVLEHVDDPDAVLAEMRRVVRADGRCLVTIINRWAHLDPHYHLWGVNFVPRSLAERYIAWRRRSKRSYRDRQTLDEMHYYSYRAFVRAARRHRFEVSPVETASGPVPRWLRRLSRTTSLGFNSMTVALEPTPAVRGRRPAVAGAGLRASAAERGSAHPATGDL